MFEGDPLEGPYGMTDQPTSSGRVFLARGFEHFCALHWGLSGREVAAALAGAAPRSDAAQVAGAARLFGQIFADGRIETAARAFGGGVPTRIAASAWELDDFTRRFAISALDPARPFHASAEPTHWIFVDGPQLDELLEASCADVASRSRPPRTERPGHGAPTQPAGAKPDLPTEERLVRLPELIRRTGMSRSTIYRRIEAKRFPSALPIDGNITAWRESEIAAWLGRK